jgi:hypothetical protein
MAPRRLHHSKGMGHPRIDTSCTHDPVKTRQFVSSLEAALGEDAQEGEDVDCRWSRLRDAMCDCAVNAYGKKIRRSTDWFEAH